MEKALLLLTKDQVWKSYLQDLDDGEAFYFVFGKLFLLSGLYVSVYGKDF